MADWTGRLVRCISETTIEINPDRRATYGVVGQTYRVITDRDDEFGPFIVEGLRESRFGLTKSRFVLVDDGEAAPAPERYVVYNARSDCMAAWGPMTYEMAVHRVQTTTSNAEFHIIPLRSVTKVNLDKTVEDYR